MCLAVPGAIVEITDTGPLTRQARISFDGVIKAASLALVPEAVVGDYVLVHAGVAISVVDEEEARKTFEYLREIDGLELEGDSP